MSSIEAPPEARRHHTSSRAPIGSLITHTTAFTAPRTTARVLVDPPTDNNTRCYPRTLAEAYPCERASAIEGPHRDSSNSPWWWIASAALVLWAAWFVSRLMGA